MKNITIYKNILVFSVKGNNLWIQQGDSICMYRNNIIERKIEILNSRFKGVYDVDLLLIEKDGCYFLQDRYGVKHLENKSLYPQLVNNIIFYQKDQNFYLYNFNNKEIIFESLIRIQYYTTELFFVCMGFPYIEYDIDCFSIDGIKKWSFNTKGIKSVNNGEIDEKGYAIRSILGICSNQVIILLYSGRIISLDVDTGTLCINIHHPKIYPDNYKNFGEKNKYNRRYQIVEDRLINLTFDFYFEILKDESGVYYQVAYNMKEEYKLNNIDNASSPVSKERWPLIDNMLLFSHTGESEYKNNMGLFNINTKKIVKTFEFGVVLNGRKNRPQYMHPLISSMIRSGDKVYIQYRSSGCRNYSLAVIDVEELIKEC